MDKIWKVVILKIMAIKDIHIKLSFLYFLGIILQTSTGYSQTFSTKHWIDTKDTSTLSLRFESTSFLKNNEYFGDFTQGFTGIGVFAKPSLEVSLPSHTNINVGIYLLKYAGIDNFSQTLPIISVQQRLFEGLDLVFGSIYSALNHRIAEPMYRFDTYYQDNVEYGLQFLYKSHWLESDLWIDWEQYIFKNDPYQEIINVGWVSNLKLLSTSRFYLNIPIQTLFYHQGGQIHKSSNEAFTIFNGMTGMSIGSNISPKTRIEFNPQIYTYKGLGISDNIIDVPTYEDGSAIYLTGKLIHELYNLRLGYWQSNKFLSPKGESLFLSESDYRPSVIEARRKILTAQTEFTYPYSDGVKFALRADGYYDLNKKNLDYSYSIFLILNENFFLTSLPTKS